MEYTLGCFTLCYQDFHRALQGIAKAGYKYVGIASLGMRPQVAPEKMSAEDVKRLSKEMEDLGLTPNIIMGHQNMLTEQGVELFKKRIDLAVELGVKIVDTGAISLHKRWPDEKKTTEEIVAESERYYSNMMEVGDYAATRGITVTLETHGGLTGTAERCLQVMDRLGSKPIRISYDTGNIIYYEGVKAEDDIGKIAKYVAAVHIKDHIGGIGEPNFPTPGDGELNFKKIFGALRKVGFNGTYTVERVSGETDEEKDREVRRALEFLDGILRRLY